MIIKKPYAFLIKHFRIIHLVLLFCLTIVLLKSHSLVNFIDSYASTGEFVYDANLAINYIPFYLFILCLLVFLVSSVVDYLMKWKKKKRVYYISLIAFYLVLIIVFIIYRSFLNNILTLKYSEKVIRAYRDIIKIFTYPQYYFILIALLRAIGFDVRKFDFKKDAQELEIDISDSEEVEVVFKSNSYKFKRSVRKFFRDLKYNIKEYKFLYILTSIILLCVIGYFGYKKYYLEARTIKENDYFNINDVEFSVDSSYITNLNYNGNKINDKYYVIVFVNMYNYGNFDTVLGLDNFKLMVDGTAINASLTYTDKFIDLGNYYNNQTLYANDDKMYYFVFEINKDQIKDDYILNIINNSTGNKFEVKISPQNIDTLSENEYNLQDLVSFDDSFLTDTYIKINSYEFGYTFEESYDYCLNNCYVARYTFKPDIINKKKSVLMKLNIDYNYNKQLDLYKYASSINDFLSLFGYITYNLNDDIISNKVNIKRSNYYSGNNIYIEVLDEVKDANNIWLDLIIRNKKYKILLK